jgi:hypothetical protein
MMARPGSGPFRPCKQKTPWCAGDQQNGSKMAQPIGLEKWHIPPFLLSLSIVSGLSAFTRFEVEMVCSSAGDRMILM